jgi:hypothetical protein
MNHFAIVGRNACNKGKVNLNSRGRGDDGKSENDAKIIKYRSKLHVISLEASKWITATQFPLIARISDSPEFLE